MNYLGIDASSTCIGWAIFQDTTLMKYGKIKPTDEKADWRERLIEMAKEIPKIMEGYNIEKVYIEDVPQMLKGGTKTLIILGAVQGILIGIFNSRHIKTEFVKVSEWRQKINLFNGTKEGKKREVLKQASIEYANKTFGIDLKWISPNSKKNDDDIADAINICWSQIKPRTRGFNKK